MVLLVALPVLILMELRRTSPRGLRRFHALDPERAHGVVSTYGRSVDWLIRLWLVSNTVVGVIALVDRDGGEVAIQGGVVTLLVVALVVRRRNRRIIMAEAEKREIAAPFQVEPRDHSPTRRRRQRQFGAVAIGALALAPLALAGGALVDSALPVVVGLAAVTLGLVAAAGYGWASAWVYGDEEPAPR